MHEGIHFTWDAAPRDVGHVALTRSLSDCAAMGARPLFCLFFVGVSGGGDEWVDGFLAGFTKLAGKYRVVLAGGIFRIPRRFRVT